MNPQSFKKISTAIVAVLLQIIFFRHLKIFGMQPDVVLVFLLWYITKSTRTTAIIMAAFLGLSQDALLDIWGLNMFAKTLVVFLSYSWVESNLNLRLQLPRILSIVLVVALAHNLIILILSSGIQQYSVELFFWRHWIGNAIYTTVIAGIVQLFRTARN